MRALWRLRGPLPSCAALAALLLALVAMPVEGHAASAFAGDLEPTQVANFIQLIEHSVRFAKMVKQGVDIVKHGAAQVKSWQQTLTQFNPSSLASLVGFVGNVSTALKGFQGITFGARSNLASYQKSHPGYVVPPDAKAAYQQLDTDTLGIAQRTLEKMDVQLNGLGSDLEVAQQLQAKIKDADGELKALSIANELLVLLNVQFSKLIATLSTHSAQMATYEANKVQRRMYEEQTARQLLGDTPKPGPAVDWSTQAFRGFN